jgi:hypothetical protein
MASPSSTAEQNQYFVEVHVEILNYVYVETEMQLEDSAQ